MKSNADIKTVWLPLCKWLDLFDLTWQGEGVWVRVSNSININATHSSPFHPLPTIQKRSCFLRYLGQHESWSPGQCLRLKNTWAGLFLDQELASHSTTDPSTYRRDTMKTRPELDKVPSSFQGLYLLMYQSCEQDIYKTHFGVSYLSISEFQAVRFGKKEQTTCCM